MLVYTLLYLLLVPKVYGDDECKYDWYGCHNSYGTLNCDKAENPGWIKIFKLCNGIRDCSDGSDEIISVCKLHPQSTSMYFQHFYCASGGVINSFKECDGNNDCWDRSDELKAKCDGFPEDNMVNSSVNEWQCLPGEIISKSKVCDHRIDCTNGKDESLEYCYQHCTPEQFQCGYGSCINKTQVCDQHIDCLDGADELPVVCSDIFNTTIAQYTECREPQSRDRLRFSDLTKHRLGKGYKYVLPTEPVHFTCPTYLDFIGTPWNVCLLNGSWHHELPKCINP